MKNQTTSLDRKADSFCQTEIGATRNQMGYVTFAQQGCSKRAAAGKTKAAQGFRASGTNPNRSLKRMRNPKIGGTPVAHSEHPLSVIRVTVACG